MAVWLGMGLGLGSPCLASAQRDPELEYRVKAGYLFNFLKLVEWPAQSRQPNEPYVVGILDEGREFQVLEAALAGKQIDGQPVLVKRLGRPEDAAGCHLVFLVRDQERRQNALLATTSGSPILTIGETAGFAERGGVLNFVFDGDKVRFEVNLGAAERQGLRLSSRLSSLAVLVKEPEQGGP